MNKVDYQILYISATKLCNEFDAMVEKYKLETIIDEKDLNRIVKWEGKLISDLEKLRDDFWEE